ncbi:polysaccharide deacetylase family protein [bacterium]|nr:polysaccharide deacetylase family protein [bacterium]
MVLAYHRVNPWYKKDALSVSPETFKRQMKYLIRRKFIPTSINEISTGTKILLEKNRFCVTFDDGFADNLWYGLPVMEKLHIRPIIFISVDFIGTNKTLPRYEFSDKERFLNWKEIKEMVGRQVEFGSHGLKHLHLPTLENKELKTEVYDSKKIIEDKIGKKVDFFCYPYGDFNQRVVDAVKEAGYAGAFVTPGKRKLEVTEYTIPRTGIYSHNNFLIFKVKIWKSNKKIEKSF